MTADISFSVEPAALDLRLVTIDSKYAGTDVNFVELTADHQVRLIRKSSTKPVEDLLPLEQLVLWGKWCPLQGGPQALLADGSLIRGEVIAWSATQITLESIDGLDEIQLPTAALRQLILQPAVWQRLLLTQPQLAQSTTANQQLVLTNGDTQVVEILDWKQNKLRCKVAGQELNLPTNQLAAIIFAGSQAKPEQPTKSLLLGFRDGSWVRASELKKTATTWQITTLAGATFTAELPELCAVQPIGGRVVYLSDMQPASYKSIPWLTLTTPAAFDTNVHGGPLVVQGQIARKGIGLRSAARLSYDLEPGALRFVAQVGIDDCTQGAGHAIARVYGDRGTGQWELLHETKPLLGGAAVQELDISLQGLKRLSLLVDFGADGDRGDIVNWLNARIERE